MMYGSPPPATASKGKAELLRGGGGGGHHHHQQQMSSGLLRFQSAPSSLLGELCEAENRFGRFLAHDPWDDKPSGADAAVDYQKTPQFRPLPPPPPEKVAFSSAPLMMYHHSQPQLQMPSLPMAAMQQIETAGSHHSSDLTRQSSSPAGFFSHLNVDNNYGAMRQMSFSSRQSSLMSQISEMASEEEEMAGRSRSSPEESVGGGYLQGGGAPAWEEETSLLSGMKNRREESHQASSGLAHQLSLPKKSPDISAIEKFLQFQDAVPCRIRAKRGCATHPRSIAERVRRTRISQRMKKLQELVPNMDKQTNTADMLDLAVDYIKDLQEQVKLLTQSQGSCTCSSGKQKPYLHS